MVLEDAPWLDGVEHFFSSSGTSLPEMSVLVKLAEDADDSGSFWFVSALAAACAAAAASALAVPRIVGSGLSVRLNGCWEL